MPLALVLQTIKLVAPPTISGPSASTIAPGSTKISYMAFSISATLLPLCLFFWSQQNIGSIGSIEQGMT